MLPLNKIYNMDCMDGMAEFPDNYFELAIVDPPYGSESDAIKTHTSNSKNKACKRTKYKQFKNVPPSQKYFKELKRVSINQIIWGVNFFGHVDLSGGRICWNKNGTAFGEAELAFCSCFNSVKTYEFTWNGMIQGDMKNKESRIHPTQKPVKLYKWLLHNYAKPGDKILDTHCGSASLPIACEWMGFEYVAFETDKDYWTDSLKRLDQERQKMQQMKMEL